jgi:tetratricopeptide (TPR) repeat protein
MWEGLRSLTETIHRFFVCLPRYRRRLVTTLWLFVTVAVFIFTFGVLKQVFWSVSENVLILPFEAHGTNASHGAAIADALVAELNRIHGIEQTYLKPPVTLVGPKQPLIQDTSNYFLRPPVPYGGSLGFTNLFSCNDSFGAAVSDVGSVNLGSAHLSLGRMIVMAREICHLRKGKQKQIAGSIFKQGGEVQIVARMAAATQNEKDFFWEASCPADAPSAEKGLITDIAFQILKDLSKSCAARSWESLKSYTTAADYYLRFCQTGQNNHLEIARSNCVSAFEMDPKFPFAAEILYGLTIPFINTTNSNMRQSAVECGQLAYSASEGKDRNIARAYIISLRNVNNLIEAERVCREAISKIPHDDMLYQEWGVCLLGLGRPLDAVEAITKAIKENEFQHSHYSILVQAYKQTGQFREAIAACEKAIEVNCGYAYVFRDEGDCFSLLGQHEEAITQYKLCKEFEESKESLTLLKLASALHKLWRFEEALSECDSALRLQWTNGDVRLMKATILLSAGRHEEARIEVDNLMKMIVGADSIPQLFVLLGLTSRAKGDFDLAISELSRAAKLTNDPQILTQLCFTHLMKGDVESAEFEAKTIMKSLAKDDCFGRFLLGLLQLKEGHLPEAQKLFAEGAAYSPVNGLTARFTTQMCNELAQGKSVSRLLQGVSKKHQFVASECKQMVALAKQCGATSAKRKF